VKKNAPPPLHLSIRQRSQVIFLLKIICTTSSFMIMCLDADYYWRETSRTSWRNAPESTHVLEMLLLPNPTAPRSTCSSRRTNVIIDFKTTSSWSNTQCEAESFLKTLDPPKKNNYRRRKEGQKRRYKKHSPNFRKQRLETRARDGDLAVWPPDAILRMGSKMKT
jgi:hypothetical protein